MEIIKQSLAFVALILVMGIGLLPAWLYKLYSGRWPSWYNIIHFQ